MGAKLSAQGVIETLCPCMSGCTQSKVAVSPARTGKAHMQVELIRGHAIKHRGRADIPKPSLNPKASVVGNVEMTMGQAGE